MLADDKLKNWRKTAKIRQIIFLLLIVIPAVIASSYMAQVLPDKGSTVLEIFIIILFFILWSGISMGFWMSLMGFITVIRKKGDKWNIANLIDSEKGPLFPKDLKIAVLMPICQEEVNRVMAGLRAIYESTAKTGLLKHYEFFILSDSRSPDVWINEEVNWYKLCETLNAHGRIHYRRRKANLKRKSGNVADFCRRWGNDFEFMIILDADSIMSGKSLNNLTEMLFKRPEAALIQTVPLGALRLTPLARLQQFTSSAYGAIFAGGLSWLLMGGAVFWGHNAIIRIKPFMEHCGLPRLSGVAPLGGDIMSHDFVESALLKRAGWEVWLAYDLKGSYEEVPPTFLDEMQRDQRWCQGNLQHLKIVTGRGFPLSQRFLFLNGAYSYMSSLFWLISLLLSSVEAVLISLRTPNYFPGTALFPSWPSWSPKWAIVLLAVTAVILFCPKIFAILAIIIKRQTKYFGGIFKLLCGAFVETLTSVVAAPIRMIFHSRFVVTAFLGRSVGWKSQNRDDRSIRFGDAFLFHASSIIFALIWGLIVFRFNRSFSYWLFPIWISLIISPVFTVISSNPGLGRKLKKWGLWLVPAETNEPWELEVVDSFVEEQKQEMNVLSIDNKVGFIKAVTDPYINSLHVSLLGGKKKVEEPIRLRRQMILERVILHGPNILTTREKTEILSDPELLRNLHNRVWLIDDLEKSKEWGL